MLAVTGHANNEMAAEVNGIYSNQYGQQPAELAASTPAHSHAPSHSVASTTASAAQQKPDPREVGWLFVEQYYTTLSKTPEKIHLFYSKRSQMVHGMEAEKVLPAVGGKVSFLRQAQKGSANTPCQAISEKIKELDIQDCKVRVLNVDSQSSFQNIVVQVIGEISNKSEPHNKFVQTFVLAEQPGGYFVLNDIFRYLNNDDNEIVDDTVEPEFSTEEMTAEPTAEEEDTMETATSDVAVEAIDAKLEESELNEQEAEESATPDAETREDQFSTSAETVETSKDLLEQPSADILAEEKPAEPEPTPSQSPPRAATPTPAVEAPPAKKTWANMVGTKAPTLPAMPAPPPAVPSQPRAYRSSQPAAPAKLPTESGATPIPSPAPASTSPTESNGWQNVDNTKKQSKPQSKAASDQITLAYIKNVNEKVDARILREVLERYGELKYFDVSRPRVSFI